MESADFTLNTNKMDGKPQISDRRTVPIKAFSLCSYMAKELKDTYLIHDSLLKRALVGAKGPSIYYSRLEGAESARGRGGGCLGWARDIGQETSEPHRKEIATAE